MIRAWAAGLIAALAAGALVASPTSADVGGPDIITFLNAQRAAQGLPGAIVEDPVLSAGCAAHNIYDQLNNGLTHGEQPSLPGYSPAGDQAGKTSVLYGPGTGPWTAAHNPFESAPIHLHQLLAPRIDRMGASETQGYGCATTLASRNAPPPLADATYTYPGDRATAWPASQTAAEGPYTPGQQVGIPAGTTTGPYLFVMFDGPDLTPFDTAAATGATLTGPAGPVAVAVVDNNTPGLQNFLPTGMEVIPRAPLAPRTTYTASVAANVTTQGGLGAPRAFGRAWSFTTGVLPNTVRITKTSALGGLVRVSATSDAPGAVAVATGPGTTAQAPFDAGTATLQLVGDGTWQVCTQSGGGTSDYAAAQDCISVPVIGSVIHEPPVAATRPFTITIPARVRHGATIKLAVRAATNFSLRFRMTARGGHVLARYPSHKLRAATSYTFRLRVPKPFSRKGATVKLTVVLSTGGKAHTVSRTVKLT